MIGTLINIVAVLSGGLLGIVLGSRLSEKIKSTITNGMGLFTLVVGIKMALETNNALYTLGGLLIGSLLGEWGKIEDGLDVVGKYLEAKFNKSDAGSRNFVAGFVTASLLFCVGPMTILGAFQDGILGNYELLAIKSVLDGFAALALASSLGPGVLFSVIIILIYQGGLTLLASRINIYLTNPMVIEMTAVGGVILMGISISSLLEIKKIRIGNFLPALIVSPLLAWLVEWIKTISGR